MSLAARCTHCQTVFRVSGPQLAAAQGWVRCGQCNHVFDATSNLVTAQGQPIEVPTVDVRQSVAPRVDVARAEPTAATPAPATPFQAMPDIDLELPDLGALKAEAAAEVARPPKNGAVVQAPPASAEPAPVDPEPTFVPDLRAEAQSAFSSDLAAVAAPTARDTPAETDRTKPPRDLRDLREPAWVEPSSGLDATPGHAATAGEPGVAAPTDAPASTGTRWGAALVALLCATLVVLFAYAARGHIAQAWPESRPAIITACSSIGCRLPALRLIEAVEVQGSSLSLDDQTGHHRLRLQLHHRGDWPVQMPAFDLSILDDSGTVIARRMLDPSEFTPSASTLNPRADIELTMTLNITALEPATMGSFRVSPFYP
jgi:predicted Zn finger-like uncharacterized protein